VSVKLMKQALPGVAASRHRPAISTGGGAGGGGAGGGGAGGSGGLPNRPPPHAVSAMNMSSAAAFAPHTQQILIRFGAFMRRSLNGNRSREPTGPANKGESTAVFQAVLS